MPDVLASHMRVTCSCKFSLATERIGKKKENLALPSYCHIQVITRNGGDKIQIGSNWYSFDRMQSYSIH